MGPFRTSKIKSFNSRIASIQNRKFDFRNLTRTKFLEICKQKLFGKIPDFRKILSISGIIYRTHPIICHVNQSHRFSWLIWCSLPLGQKNITFIEESIEYGKLWVVFTSWQCTTYVLPDWARRVGSLYYVLGLFVLSSTGRYSRQFYASIKSDIFNHDGSLMMRRADDSDRFLRLPDNVLITVVIILCFDASNEAYIDDSRFSLQYVCKRFYTICNSDALWQNKPIILTSGKFNEGAFKLIKKKTQGTEGICYHAYCRPHRREYAVKRVSRVSSENEGVPYYMLRVLSALKNLQHPGINELLYVSLVRSRLYTIYPYIELTLQDIIFTVQNFGSLEEVRGGALAITSLSSPLKQHISGRA